MCWWIGIGPGLLDDKDMCICIVFLCVLDYWLIGIGIGPGLHANLHDIGRAGNGRRHTA